MSYGPSAVLSELPPQSEREAKRGVAALFAGSVVMLASVTAEAVFGIPDTVVTVGALGGAAIAAAGLAIVGKVIRNNGSPDQ